MCSFFKEDTHLVEDILKMPGPSFLQMKIQYSSNDLGKGSKTCVLLIQGTFLEAEGALWELELFKKRNLNKESTKFKETVSYMFFYHEQVILTECWKTHSGV